MASESVTDSAEVRLLLREGKGLRGGRENTLAVFRTGPSASSITLRAPSLLYYGVLSGRTFVEAPETEGGELRPGESLLVPPLQSVRMRFPEAETTPTQWLVLRVNQAKTRTLLEGLDESIPAPSGRRGREQEQPYCRVEQQEGIHRVLRLISSLFDEAPPDRDVLIDLNVKQLLVRLLRTRARPLLVDEYPRHSAEGGIAAAVQYIQDHLDRHILIDELVEEACMSKSSFYRHFSDEFDMSPLEYITRERVDRARELLGDRTRTVAEVSHALGFSSTSYFIDMFREHVGETPKQYQIRVSDEAAST